MKRFAVKPVHDVARFHVFRKQHPSFEAVVTSRAHALATIEDGHPVCCDEKLVRNELKVQVPWLNPW